MERESLAGEARRQSELVSRNQAPHKWRHRRALSPQDAPLFRIPVPAGRMTGLKLESQVMVDKVIAIPRNKITGRAGALAAGPLKEIDNALRLWLELV